MHAITTYTTPFQNSFLFIILFVCLFVYYKLNIAIVKKKNVIPASTAHTVVLDTNGCKLGMQVAKDIYIRYISPLFLHTHS